jgi:hypothetical protein
MENPLMRFRILTSVSLLVLLMSSFAYAQRPLLHGNVPVKFSAGGRELPAGQYTFSRDSEGKWITIEGPGKTSIRVPVVTRLAAQMHTTPKDAHLIFDKTSEANYLSEIWVPTEDGFLLRTTKARHQHEVVDVPE